jgi:hypothetical protein
MHRLRLFIQLPVVLALLAGTARLGSAESYRRWLAPKMFTCSHGVDSAAVTLDNQNIEFSDLPAGALFTLNYVDNGVTTTNGPYGVEQTSGTKAYGSFQESFPSYPFTFEFRLDTIVNGQVIYRSSLSVSCSDDASGSAAIVNAVGPLPTTTTSIVTTTTTTSTTLPAGCEQAASVASIDCRLGNLLEQIAVVTSDDALRTTLAASASQARDAVRAAETETGTRARKRLLGRANKALGKVAAKLRRADGTLDTQRASLLRLVAALRSDVLVLRSTPAT